MKNSGLHTCPRRLIGALMVATLGLAMAAPALAAGTLDKIRESGKVSLGFRADTRPFAYADESGKAAGFSVALCQKVAQAVKAELKLPELAVDFIPVTAASRFEALQQGQIDLECGTSTPTIERRAIVDFSIPIFNAGIGAVTRADADRRLRDALADRPDPGNPVWRGAPGVFTKKVVFAVVGATTIERSLIDGLRARRIDVTVEKAPDYATGLQMVRDGRAAALFGDRPVLLDAAKRAPAGELAVIERSFTREPLALAMRRGDDAFRLIVDRSLSRLFRSKDFGPLYTGFFGTPAPGTLELFESMALPD